MTDVQLICNDCTQEFTFTSEDQEFFRKRGYSTPRLSKPCRQAKKNEQASGAEDHTNGGGYQSESRGTGVTCSGGGGQTTVPFEPRGDCQGCYQAKRKTLGGPRSFGRRR